MCGNSIAAGGLEGFQGKLAKRTIFCTSACSYMDDMNDIYQLYTIKIYKVILKSCASLLKLIYGFM
jgi:hypothetical protein